MHRITILLYLYICIIPLLLLLLNAVINGTCDVCGVMMSYSFTNYVWDENNARGDVRRTCIGNPWTTEFEFIIKIVSASRSLESDHRNNQSFTVGGTIILGLTCYMCHEWKNMPRIKKDPSPPHKNKHPEIKSSREKKPAISGFRRTFF